MARQKNKSKNQLDSYTHADKQRLNNPPVGLVTPDTDPEGTNKNYSYDPHLDPQLVWAGKAEHTSFDVRTVSLHVHERIDPRTILEAVQKQDEEPDQPSLFEQERKTPLRQDIEFYKHKHNWSNRLIAGDSLLVMNSLIEKEGLGGQLQTMYIDPPYGIKYRSNFQPFVGAFNLSASDKDEELTQEPEMIKAFRDTWELGIHSYLSYLRDRLLLSRELLHDSGSCFVQISDENLHHVRELMDEVFGKDNFCGLIAFRKTGGLQSTLLASVADYIVWYAKDRSQVKFRRLNRRKQPGEPGATQYKYTFTNEGKIRELHPEELASAQPDEVFTHDNLTSQGNPIVTVSYKGKQYSDRYKTTREGMEKLIAAGRVAAIGNTLRYIRYLSDHPVSPITELWDDTAISGFERTKNYVVYTSPAVVERCILMTTDPGDLVMDPTCGGGTTAYSAEKWGRRWITCDTSRVAVALTKIRLTVASFQYFQLAYPEEGISSGFKYTNVPHITLKSIVHDQELRSDMDLEMANQIIRKNAEQEPQYDQPKEKESTTRVTGPFTVEAVPSPTVNPIDDVEEEGEEGGADESLARQGETARQAEWRDELFKTGIRGKAGQNINFTRVEPLAGTRWLHADGETEGEEPQRVVVSFGPEYAPMEQRQVALALEEAQHLVPKPKLVVFAAFQFDPEAAKDIDETNWPGVTLLKAQMNADMLTEDLKKKRASNQSFWLIGQPDVKLEEIKDGEDSGRYRISLDGFDYYNTRTGDIESGGPEKIAMWMLDPDYDGRSLFPRQVFFPMAGPKDGWDKLAKNLKAEINEELIEAYRGKISLPFESGEHGRAAVKIVDDRGIESFKVVPLS